MPGGSLYDKAWVWWRDSLVRQLPTPFHGACHAGSRHRNCLTLIRTGEHA